MSTDWEATTTANIMKKKKKRKQNMDQRKWSIDEGTKIANKLENATTKRQYKFGVRVQKNQSLPRPTYTASQLVFFAIAILEILFVHLFCCSPDVLLSLFLMFSIGHPFLAQDHSNWTTIYTGVLSSARRTTFIWGCPLCFCVCSCYIFCCSVQMFHYIFIFLLDYLIRCQTKLLDK